MLQYKNAFAIVLSGGTHHGDTRSDNITNERCVISLSLLYVF